MDRFSPEGTPGAREVGTFSSLSQITDAIDTGAIFEGPELKCDSAYNLLLDLGAAQGVLPFAESAIGADCGRVREISVITRVGRSVCFAVTELQKTTGGQYRALLSRRQVQLRCQQEFLDALVPGDVIDAVITHFEPFDVFVDIGCGIVSLLPIDCISVSRISHPKDRFYPGQHIRVVVTGRDQLGRITLSHKELLGSWEQNAADFSAGDTVFGTVRSIENYGVFVELRPNLAGLAELKDDVQVGDRVSVYIKSIIPEKMKIKLIIIDTLSPAPAPREKLRYYFTGSHMDQFCYSPAGCLKQVHTQF